MTLVAYTCNHQKCKANVRIYRKYRTSRSHGCAWTPPSWRWLMSSMMTFSSLTRPLFMTQSNFRHSPLEYLWKSPTVCFCWAHILFQVSNQQLIKTSRQGIRKWSNANPSPGVRTRSCTTLSVRKDFMEVTSRFTLILSNISEILPPCFDLRPTPGVCWPLGTRWTEEEGSQERGHRRRERRED